MVRAVAPAVATSLSSASVPTPPTNLSTSATLTKWAAGQTIHRIHSDPFRADQFNPSFGNARFSPIRAVDGAWVPTLYGATSFEGAAMETVFHDVPYVPGLKTFDGTKLDGKCYSTLTPVADLLLMDLTGLPLRKLGVQRSQLIDTEKDTYPETRLWAEACHAQLPSAQGMLWVSRQHDTTLALVLFEDRIPVKTLRIVQAEESILTPPAGHYSRLLHLARAIDVKIV